MYNEDRMSEEQKKQSSFFEEPISRRTALGRIGKIVGGAVGLSLGLHSRPADARVSAPPEYRLFDDILNEEELSNLHIRVVNTDKVTLQLRRGIFDFPLFQDAREGKLKEVILVLVDHPSLSWNSSYKMSEEARLVFQAHQSNPQEYTESYWKSRQDKESSKEILYQEQRKKWADELSKAEAGFKKASEKRDSIIRKIMETTDKHQRELLEQSLKSVNTLVDILAGSVSFYIRAESNAMVSEFEAKNNLFDLQFRRGEIIEKESEQNTVNGQFVSLDLKDDITPHQGIEQIKEFDPEGWRRNSDLLRKYPELRDKVFIFLAVGGKNIPNPQDSYLSPEKYKELDLESAKEKGFYRFTDPYTAGSTLRHEVYHYNSDGVPNSEYLADTGGFDSVVRAWEEKQRTGNAVGYPFVFITRDGITVTKDMTSSNTDVSV